MRRAFADMNPFVRGLLIVAVIALVVVVLQLEATLTALFLLAQIAFLLAIAFFVYLVWRERRSEIATWSRRAYWVFYGAAVLAVADVVAFIFSRPSGPDALAFVLVLIFCGFSMWRAWRDEHTFGL